MPPKIVLTPGTCGGKPRIEGHRFPVHSVVIYSQQGMSAADIAEDYPLELEEVNSALDYYKNNQHQIDEIIAVNKEFFDSMSTLSKLWGADSFVDSSISIVERALIEKYEQRLEVVGVFNE